MSKTVTSIPARQFARDLAGAKRAADSGPVLITDRGHPAYALLRIEDYYELAGQGRPSSTLLDLMKALPSTAGIDFQPGHLTDAPVAPNID